MISLLKDNSSEDEIIAGLKAGGTQRLISEKRLYECFFYLIKQGAHKHSITEDEAASAYSDAVISIIDNVITGKFEGRSSLKSYACQIFINKCVDIVRKKTTNKYMVHNTSAINDHLTALPDKAKSIVQQIIEKSQRNSLLQKLEEIGEKCKRLLLLFEDGYTDKEIAEIMQYNSADVVKTSRLRCLEKLREKVFNPRN